MAWYVDTFFGNTRSSTATQRYSFLACDEVELEGWQGRQSSRQDVSISSKTDTQAEHVLGRWLHGRRGVEDWDGLGEDCVKFPEATDGVGERDEGLEPFVPGEEETETEYENDIEELTNEVGEMLGEIVGVIVVDKERDMEADTEGIAEFEGEVVVEREAVRELDKDTEGVMDGLNDCEGVGDGVTVVEREGFGELEKETEGVTDGLNETDNDSDGVTDGVDEGSTHSKVGSV